jgi:hypothetical protein
VPNNHIRRDLQMTSVKEEICRSSNQYCTRLTTHPNDQILTLIEIPGNRCLGRHVPNDLPNRFVLVILVFFFKSPLFCKLYKYI